jgi:transposase
MFCYSVTKMENNNLEQIHAVKFCFKLGEGAKDTYDKIQKAFGNDSVSRAQVFRWNKGFANGRETLEDEPRSGRPASENKHKRRPCEGFHSSRSMPDNWNDRR